MENIKKFYIALSILYNKKEYNEAIKLLKSLLSEDTKNIRYAFHIYRAETLKSYNNKIDISLLNQTNQDWDNFINSLKDEEKKGLSDLSDWILYNNLFYYTALNDSFKFDQTVNKLSKRYLYDDEIIPIIYNYYVKRELHELAFEYIFNSEQYLINSNIPISPTIQTIIDNSSSIMLLEKYKISLRDIRNLAPKDIPKITPDTINNKRHLNKFILNELIQALSVIREKREALRQITHENRFNDFIQAILRLRFPIWGWSILDQPRLDTSTGGADAGNADLVVQSGGGMNFALIEAFILKDKDYTQKHIIKCPKYIGTINNYYVIIYYLDNSVDFESKWSTYKSDVLSISYPSNFSIDTNIGFIDIANEFENVNNFKIAKTTHINNIELFHVMVNLGT